ncbi:uncharacterized protein LOC118928522 isoform X3 [Manis pentadactyla]|nr:uncharacterized protein LOC118928522 isoform X3 [Manis pentadactyla]
MNVGRLCDGERSEAGEREGRDVQWLKALSPRRTAVGFPSSCASQDRVDRRRQLKGSGSEAPHGPAPRPNPALPHPVTGGAARATRSPPLRTACREPETLPVAPGHGTPTPIGPRENRNGVTRALSELVVPSLAVLHSRKQGRTEPRATEAQHLWNLLKRNNRCVKVQIQLLAWNLQKLL